MTEIQALKSELESLRSERTAWRVTAENAEKQLEDLKASIGEPVARVSGWTNGSHWRNYKLEWLNSSANEGDLLYAIKEVK